MKNPNAEKGTEDGISSAAQTSQACRPPQWTGCPPFGPVASVHLEQGEAVWVVGKGSPQSSCSDWETRLKSQESIYKKMIWGEELPKGVSIIELPREAWGCGQLGETPEEPQRLLRQMAYVQVKAFAQTKATVWRELGENGHPSPELVLLQGGSIGKHFHDCDLNIESSGADPFLNHHQMECADQRPCTTLGMQSIGPDNELWVRSEKECQTSKKHTES
ncbi:hypothetical protein MC885_005951 [Smutsia gigantea]|nr:hypothetical protein MC885_005951 [Smutsia gigantea]